MPTIYGRYKDHQLVLDEPLDLPDDQRVRIDVAPVVDAVAIQAGDSGTTSSEAWQKFCELTEEMARQPRLMSGEEALDQVRGKRALP